MNRSKCLIVCRQIDVYSYTSHFDLLVRLLLFLITFLCIYSLIFVHYSSILSLRAIFQSDKRHTSPNIVSILVNRNIDRKRHCTVYCGKYMVKLFALLDIFSLRDVIPWKYLLIIYIFRLGVMCSCSLYLFQHIRIKISNKAPFL